MRGAPRITKWRMRRAQAGRKCELSGHPLPLPGAHRRRVSLLALNFLGDALRDAFDPRG